jgi:hypothetical protein
MNTATNRQRLARFIDVALTPWSPYGRPIAAVPIPRSVLATCGEEMHVLADALRDERRTVDAGTLRELQQVLTHGASSPLYDGATRFARCTRWSRSSRASATRRHAPRSSAFDG